MILESAHVLGFLLAVSLIAAGMVLICFCLRKKDRLASAYRCQQLQSKLEIHQIQIRTRALNLKQYDLQEYNLKEILMCQISPKWHSKA